MKYFDDHSSVFFEVFASAPPEELDLSYNSGLMVLEDQNPSDAIEVAQRYDEVDGGRFTWIINTHYFVCSVPKRKTTYLLYAIDWDDNYGVWQRESCAAVRGVNSIEEAIHSLLTKFAKEHIAGAETGNWRDFLEQFL